MNIFVEEIEEFQFGIVRFYSIRVDDNEYNEFERFLRKHEQNSGISEELDQLFQFLEEMGDKYGAREQFFRFENQAHAIPKHSKQFPYIEKGAKLRLYCLRLNDHVVFLFHGGIKTKHSAQDCKNVSIHFHNANRFVQKINELIRNNEILFNEKGTELTFDKDGYVT